MHTQQRGGFAQPPPYGRGQGHQHNQFATVQPLASIAFRVTTINVLFQGFYEKHAVPEVKPVPEALRMAWARKYLDHQAPATDVFLFQEWSSSAARELTPHLTRLGFTVSAPVTDQMPSVVGCAIAWKDSSFVPSCPPQAFLFDQSPRGQFYSQPNCKQLVVAGLRHLAAPDVEILIGSTHLPFSSSASERADKLHRLTAPLFPPGSRVAAVLAGDFNAVWDQSGLREGLPTGWQTAEENPNTPPELRGTTHFDHFLCSPDVNCALAAVGPSPECLITHKYPQWQPTGEWFSDHVAVSATIEVPAQRYDSLTNLVRASAMDLAPLQLRPVQEYYRPSQARGSGDRGRGSGGPSRGNGNALPNGRGSGAPRAAGPNSHGANYGHASGSYNPTAATTNRGGYGGGRGAGGNQQHHTSYGRGTGASHQYHTGGHAAQPAGNYYPAGSRGTMNRGRATGSW